MKTGTSDELRRIGARQGSPPGGVCFSAEQESTDIRRCILTFEGFIREGLIFKGARVPLNRPTGYMLNRKSCREIPLSIRTAPEIPGMPRPYDDRPAESGVMLYRYQGSDPGRWDNVGLAQGHGLSASPLIYLFRSRNRSVQARSGRFLLLMIIRKAWPSM